MKALVLWTEANPRTTSVVDTQQIKKFGSILKAQWENSWYEVKVIEENEDEDWLNLLEISTDGEILSYFDVCDSQVIAKKRKTKRELRLEKLNKKRKLENIAYEYFQQKSKFSENEITDVEVEKEDFEKIEDQTSNEENIANDHRSSSNPCMFCSNVSLDMTFQEKFINVAKTAVIVLSELIEQAGFGSINKTKLCPEYPVFVDSYKLNTFKIISKNNNRRLIRLILLELIGEEKLSQLSGSTLPEDICKALFYYVNQNNKKPINNKDFIRCVTLYCSSIKTKIKRKKIHDQKEKLQQ